jgi:uncharacterized protein (TIGR00251 family)
MSAAWIRYDAAARTLRLSIYVQPNARTSDLAGLHGEDLKVRIAAPAIDNKANAAVRTFFAEALGVPPSSVTVLRGAASRRKVLEVRDAGAELKARAIALADGSGSFCIRPRTIAREC